MSDNVIQFPRGVGLDDKTDLDPYEMFGVLRDEVKMTEAIVVGWTEEGNLCMSTSHSKAPDMVFLLELAKSVLLNRCVSEDEDE